MNTPAVKLILLDYMEDSAREYRFRLMEEGTSFVVDSVEIGPETDEIFISGATDSQLIWDGTDPLFTNATGDERTIDRVNCEIKIGSDWELIGVAYRTGGSFAIPNSATYEPKNMTISFLASTL